MWAAASFSDRERWRAKIKWYNVIVIVNAFICVWGQFSKNIWGKDMGSVSLVVGTCVCTQSHRCRCVWNGCLQNPMNTYSIFVPPLPQALWVSTELSELGEYFLLLSERSLSEWQIEGLREPKKKRGKGEVNYKSSERIHFNFHSFSHYDDNKTNINLLHLNNPQNYVLRNDTYIWGTENKKWPWENGPGMFKKY